MKTLVSFIFILLFVPSLAFAGEIYGTIKGSDGKPLTSQIVQIKANDQVIASDTTDVNGYFRVNIKQVGKFKLEIEAYKGTSVEVFSSNNSTRYNLLLQKEGDKWILKNL